MALVAVQAPPFDLKPLAKGCFTPPPASVKNPAAVCYRQTVLSFLNSNEKTGQNCTQIDDSFLDSYNRGLEISELVLIRATIPYFLLPSVLAVWIFFRNLTREFAKVANVAFSDPHTMQKFVSHYYNYRWQAFQLNFVQTYQVLKGSQNMICIT